MTTNTFEPDYAVAPGPTLKEILEDRGMSQAELSLRTGLAEKTISQIVNGVAPLTYDTADKLELVLGVPARFWNTRELHYRESLARHEEESKLATHEEWLSQIPIDTLIERGVIDGSHSSGALVRQVLRFFAVSSVEAWNAIWLSRSARYRGGDAQERRPGFVAAWMRIGDIQSERIKAEPFDAGEFKMALKAVRNLTMRPASVWRREVPELCARAGVIVVFTREIPGAAVSGATRWQTKDRALIQLSLKFKSDDQLWYTFFHEAGHILRHGKRQVFIDYGLFGESEEEREANEFARDLLIPAEFKDRLPHLRDRAQIKAFAHSLGIAAGIVVGRLQFDKLIYQNAFNDLKVKLSWKR